MKYIDIKENLYKITTEYPETIDIFVNKGFSKMKEEKAREIFGKSITLETALKLKSIESKAFVAILEETIENNRNNIDQTLIEKEFDKNADITIQGVLPCPIRIPLLERWTSWLAENKSKLDYSVSYKLQAASMGVDWLAKDIRASEDESVLSDLFISAGFDLFFDKELMGKFKSLGAFEDITGIEKYNSDFDNEYINLKDPDTEYSILGVVPAIFLVNKEELGDIEMPSAWADILQPEFEGRVSLPIGDFDLFNAILLNIYKNYGKEGVGKLGKSLFRGMHPSEMVKSHRQAVKPLITIMPYFFTKMVQAEGPMVPIWPKDGAIISPIFMLSKKSKKEKLKPIVEFFASKAVGEVLAHQGRFPSTHPEVDNKVASENKYMWLGWEFIKNNDIGKLIAECEALFKKTSEKIV